jgi:hypothetical protein
MEILSVTDKDSLPVVGVAMSVAISVVVVRPTAYEMMEE